jgi:glycosyltransferase involved in cell wall biosynthesis
MTETSFTIRILLVHHNFPAQFRNIAKELANRPEFELAAIGCETASALAGVKLVRYQTPAGEPAAHAFARRFEHECRRAEQVMYAATDLIDGGFVPDLIFVHAGWGENLPLKSIFPKAKLVVYCEFYYRTSGQDFGFDPEFPASGIDGLVELEARNASTLLGLAQCDRGLSPTYWQFSTYPQEFKSKIAVIHEGVDTEALRPDDNAALLLPTGRQLTRKDKVVTYSARNLEPTRGFHTFMRALPQILRRQPDAEGLIVGGDGVSYGRRPLRDPNWKSAMLREVGARLDPDRVHFLGRLPYDAYLNALQISSAHVYLTYPFVLSWSLLEAMSCGCVVVASDTAPVREVVNKRNGVLSPFFSPEVLAEKVCSILAAPEAYRSKRIAARRTVVTRYDAKKVCVPKAMALIRSLVGSAERSAGHSASSERLVQVDNR